jgi:AraC-like DNA-binding protein
VRHVSGVALADGTYVIGDVCDHRTLLLLSPRHSAEEMDASSLAGNRPVIVALATDRSVLEHVRLALRHEPYALFLTDDRGQFLAAIGESNAKCAVVALGESTTGGALHVVRRVRARAPCLWTIGYGVGHQGLTPMLIAATRAGLDEVVLTNAREPHALRAAVQRAWFRSEVPVDELLSEFTNRVTRGLLALLQRCLPLVTAQTTVTQLAGALRLHRNTLGNRLARARGPNSERFRAWCLLIRVGHLLDETSWPIERIALHLDFSSASALGHLVTRYLELTPTILRASGALQTIADRLASECTSRVGPGRRTCAPDVPAERA